MTKRLAAAQALAERMPSSEISLAKTESVLGTAIDVTRDDYETNEELLEESLNFSVSRTHQERAKDQEKDLSPSDRKKLTRKVLASQTNEYRAFERLIWALTELDNWRRVVDEKPRWVCSRLCRNSVFDGCCELIW